MRRLDFTSNYGEARVILRERLVRFLPTNSASPLAPHLNSIPPLSDQDAIVFFQRLSIQANNDVARARKVYESVRKAVAKRSRPALAGDSALHDAHFKDRLATTENVDEASGRNSGGTLQHGFSALNPVPTFDQLMARGWILSSWNRFSIPRRIAPELLGNEEECTEAFRAISASRGEYTYKTFLKGLPKNSRVRALLCEVNSKDHQHLTVTCLAPDWVAARLWDTPEHESILLEEPEEKLSRWLDRWSCLKHPSFAAHQYLEEDAFTDFIETAMKVLVRPQTTPDWVEFESQVGRVEALLSTGRQSSSESADETIRRDSWLSHGMPEHAFHDQLHSRGSALVYLLLNELTEGHFDSLRIGPRLMRLAAQRPVILGLLGIHARCSPVILADMLLAKETCTLACSIITSWRHHDGGWFKGFQPPADSVTNLLAFDDALAVLTVHLDGNGIPAREIASLYEFVYKQAEGNRQFERARDMLPMLRELLATLPSEYYDSVVSELIKEADGDFYPLPQFFAALDLIAEAGCVERLDPKQIVTCYLSEILPKGHRISHNMLDAQGARALCALALRASDEVKQKFLEAVNSKELRVEYVRSKETLQSGFEETACARIRLHIRMLSRAIAAWSDAVPEELVDALATAIWAGATEKPEQGRFGAFVPFSTIGIPDEPAISRDLAAALMRLPETPLRKIVRLLCAVDEPTVLAGIVAETSESIHEEIKAQIALLTPDIAPNIYPPRALFSRIHALLNAELVDAALPYVQLLNGRNATSAFRGRETELLRIDLRIQLLQKDWKGLSERRPLRGGNYSEMRQQYDLVLYFQAIGEMANPQGDAAVAEARFKELTEGSPDTVAYSVNLFASRVKRFLGKDSGQLLTGKALAEAQSYLSDVEKNLVPRVKQDAALTRILTINRAMLFLATGHPKKGLGLLNSLRDGHLMEHVEGFRALAMARSDSVDEAKTTLTVAERHFGRSSFLTGIRENIEKNRPFFTPPHLSIDGDPIPGLRDAIFRLRSLGHVDQAQVLHSHGIFEKFLMEEVRGACASLSSLAPMLRELGVAKEDDISSVLKQLLRSRFIFPQWTVEDQPRGGWSETLGVGERDFAFSKGTAELAVVEAVKVSSIDKRTLTSHFRKLFGYGECSIFFHLTYLMSSNLTGVLDFLKQECAKPPSAEIELLKTIDLPHIDSLPRGFEAHYRVDDRNCYVVFLVLDMGQLLQKEAAKKQKPKCS